ncbi:MAG: iron uptake porin, partial [Waterburya sp.]
LQIAGTYVHGKFTDGAILDDDGDESDSDSSIFDLGVGTSLASKPFGDGVETSTNSYGVEAAFELNERIALNAFGMYTDAQQDEGDQDAEIWSYGAGLSLPDLGKEGNLAAVFVGAEPYNGTANQDVPLHIEGLYKYQFNDNVSITPGVVYLISPNGSEDDEDALIGALRTTFTF